MTVSPGAQVEAADLRRRDVDVVGAGLVVVVRAAQEAEAVGQQLEHALGVDLEALVRDAREDGEDQVLLLQALEPSMLEVVGELRQLGDLHPLQVIELDDLHRRAFAHWLQARSFRRRRRRGQLGRLIDGANAEVVVVTG